MKHRDSDSARRACNSSQRLPTADLTCHARIRRIESILVWRFLLESACLQMNLNFVFHVTAVRFETEMCVSPIRCLLQPLMTELVSGTHFHGETPRGLACSSRGR